MPDLLVAVWGAQERDFETVPPWQKMMHFVDVAGRVYGTMRRLSLQRGMVNPIFLLAVPEYFFVTAGDRGPLASGDAQAIVAAIRTISATLPKLVIVPGTINFTTPLNAFIRESVFAGRDARTHGVLSRCPVFHAGTLVRDYYKRTNDRFFDSQAQWDGYFIPGSSPATFSAGGLRMGVDVCMDWSMSKLAGDAPNRDLDVHIVVSGTHANDFNAIDRVAARDGGYFVHCDSVETDQKNGVWRVARGHGEHGRYGRNLDRALENRRATDRFQQASMAGKLVMIKHEMELHARRTGPDYIKNVTQISPAERLDRFLNVYHCPMD